MIKEMSIDLETYSDVDISKCGAYKYAESDNFEILLFGVSIDGGEVQVFDLACGDTIPDGILAALSDDTVTKWAFNANFERICLSHWLKKHHPEHFKGYNILEDPASKYLDPASWKCRIFGTVQVPVMTGIPALYRHILTISNYDIEVISINLIKALLFKHSQPPY